MIVIDTSIKENKKKTLSYQSGIFGRIVFLNEKDLNNIDFILCGQDFEVALVPRELTKKELEYIEVCQLDAKEEDRRIINYNK